MFQIRTPASARLSSFVRSLSFLVLLLVGSPAEATNACASATPVELNTTFRTYADVGEPLLVKLEIPSAGILSVDVIATNTFSSDVGNGLLSLDCLPRAASKPIVVERSPEHQILAVSGSGTYVFRVASLDRHRPLGELKLLSAFVPGGHSVGEDEDDIEVDGLSGPSHSLGEDEDDIEVDGFADPGHSVGEDEDDIEVDGFADPSHSVGEDEDDIEVDGFADPGHSVGEDEDDIEVDGFVDPNLCRLGEVDDHGDSFHCATYIAVGSSVNGEIGNSWRDDADTFRFVLDGSDADLRTLVIETVGSTDTISILYDQTGQLLDVSDERGRDDNYRIARALRPGVYFVRIQGLDGSEGPFDLRVAAKR